MSKLISRSVGFDFRGTQDAVWAAMADTARFNEAAALPKHRIEEVPQPDGTVSFIAHAKAGPFALEWEDLPCNWVRGHWLEHRRRFRRGPLQELNARFDLRPTGTLHGIRAAAHSVLTEDLVDEPGHPTRDALDQVLELFRSRLLDAA